MSRDPTADEPGLQGTAGFGRMRKVVEFQAEGGPETGARSGEVEIGG